MVCPPGHLIPYETVPCGGTLRGTGKDPGRSAFTLRTPTPPAVPLGTVHSHCVLSIHWAAQPPSYLMKHWISRLCHYVKPSY